MSGFVVMESRERLGAEMTDELESLIADCKSIYVEKDFESRWARVEVKENK